VKAKLYGGGGEEVDQIAQLLALQIAHDKRPDERRDPAQDEAGANKREHKVDLHRRIVMVIPAPLRAHEPHPVERHEDAVESDKPEPERDRSPEMVELKPERLGEPVYGAG
jgi:hypothetical protein